VCRGEVTPTATDCISCDAEQDAERGTDQERRPNKTEVWRLGEDEQYKSKKQSEPGAAGRTRKRDAPVGQFPSDTFDSFEVISDNGELLYVEVCLREAVNDSLSFGVGVVGAEGVSARDRREDGTAAGERALVGHLSIVPRATTLVPVSATRVFVARLAGCSVFDPAGDRVGKVRDVVVVYRSTQSPSVVGLIVEVPGKRRVFLGIGRVTSIGSGQIITTGLINMRRFQQRGGEVRVIAEMLGRKVTLRDRTGEATIEDVAIQEADLGEWEVSQLFCRQPKTTASPFGKGATVFVNWSDVVEKTTVGESQSATQLVATYADFLPADLANAMLDLPGQRMLEVADELPDSRLADVLEEMPESDQVDIMNQLDDARAADVLDHMQPDDAADLIAQLSDERGEALLELMEPEEAEDVRFLLSYAPETAGGLMTTEPIIVSADTTVAEGLALIRRHELAPALGAAICVTLPPYEPPTGRFLGMVHFQRMLRYPPNERLGTLLDQSLEPVMADAPAAEVARILASYNLVSVPVIDENRRLVGVVTIDDVLDYLLPDDWRSTDHNTPRTTIDTSTSTIPLRTSTAKTRRTGNGTR
jgi:CBS domain-containing protein/sporulation protein YlmC with PRC-barrel domain